MVVKSEKIRISTLRNITQQARKIRKSEINGGEQRRMLVGSVKICKREDNFREI